MNLWTATTAPLSITSLASPPERADVAIVGGGYTGMSAARSLARHGADVVVLEQETLGWGASSRNGGFVLPGYKAEVAALARRFGLERARALWRFSLDAVDFVERVVAQEHIDCDFRRCGHVALAARPSHLKELERERLLLQERFGHDTVLLDRAQVRQEIGSSRYYGGLLDPAAGGLQPAAYFAGLARAAVRAGAKTVERCEVRRIRRQGDGFELDTARGVVRSREVLVATNGYGGRVLPDLARRVIPIGSFIIATVPLEEEIALHLVPRGRVLSDTKNLLYYFRVWNRRLVFGGRASFAADAERQSRNILRRGIEEVYPEIAHAPIEYSWGGQLGFALDYLPHAGTFQGVHYALAYAGHGVALASYLGHRMGELLAGKGEQPPVWGLPFPAVPLYHGTPWFLPIAGAYFRLRDWVG